MAVGALEASSSGWAVLDACACAGGNTLSFARAGAVDRVTAVEIDPDRARALSLNLATAGVAVVAAGSDGATAAAAPNLNSRPSVRVICGDYAALARAGSLPRHDLLFVDPPWGGPAYSARAVIQAGDLGLSGWPLPEIVLAARSPAGAAGGGVGPAAVACSLPPNYDLDSIAKAITARQAGAAFEADRPLPFTAEFGTRVLLLCLFPPGPSGSGAELEGSRREAAAARFAFPTRLLDSLVAGLRAWDEQHARQHRPRFFDWEKQRWIAVSRWLGAKPVRPPLVSEDGL